MAELLKLLWDISGRLLTLSLSSSAPMHQCLTLMEKYLMAYALTVLNFGVRGIDLNLGIRDKPRLDHIRFSSLRGLGHS